MMTVGNLLHMDRCASCERELASTWQFCIYCGRPLVLANDVPPALDTRTTDIPEPELDSEPDEIPAAIRVEHDEPPARRYDGAFWVGVGMGALGLILIIYAAVQIVGSAA